MTTPHNIPLEPPHPSRAAPTPCVNRRVHEDGSTELTVVGEIEWTTTGPLTSALLDGADHTTVTLDLRDLVWADSSLLHVLINAQRHLRHRNTALILRGPLQPVLERLFTITGTHSYFTFHNVTPED
ncbi:STAS domain-containing protein [Streptomyces sp. NPDC001571]|uniref:STAS domain-containing protein n=1 Tax=Streptomyces sp. NPDC002506 TaxID=3154536 RepID=UPI003331C3E1